MAKHVIVRNAPGFDPDTRGTIVDGLENVGSSDQGPMTVIRKENGDFLAVPARFVEATESPEAARYREEWATKAHRNAREVYVPEALR